LIWRIDATDTAAALDKNLPAASIQQYRSDGKLVFTTSRQHLCSANVVCDAKLDNCHAG
jgi:hypothetical protein